MEELPPARAGAEADPAEAVLHHPEASSAARPSLAHSEDLALARRLTWLSALRLILITVVLVVLTTVYLPRAGGFSGLLALGTVAASYAFAAGFAVALRSGRGLATVASLQILVDQLLWTAIVYVTGATSSAGTSLYGLTCLSGAILLGRRGAFLAAASGVTLLVALQIGLWTGVVPIPSDQAATIYDLTPARGAFPLFTSTTGILVVAALAGYLAERLRKTGGDLAQATERAEKAEQLAALGRLAAGLAHEIRNPLGSIQGSIELLRTGGSLGEDDRRLCEIIERETARLNELVGDMLDLSRPREPALEVVDLPLVARDVVELASRSGRGGEVGVRFEGLDRGAVQADPAMLRQVVWNLVRNAVQASSAGDEVRVEVKARDGRLQLSVVDDGQGIAAEALPQLFDAFYTTRSHGTGVGLAVVKRIADAHGWALSVDTRPGKGATFKVAMPRASAIEAPRPAPEPGDRPRGRGE